MPKTDYKTLAAGDYGTSSAPGLEIIGYYPPKEPNKDGSLRHSFLVKAILPSRQQAELIAKAKSNGGGSNPYLDEPDFDGTTFLSVNLRNEWLQPALVAVAMGREQVVLASKKVDQAQLDAAQKYLLETATETATTFGDPTSEAVDEAVEKLKQKIQIEVGTLYRLQKWAGVPEDEQADLKTLEGTQFSGSITEREYNGRTYTDVKVRPKGKK